MIRAVLFDVDGVLLDSFEANLKFYHDLALQTGYTPPTRESHRETFHLPMWDKIKIMTGLESPEEIQKIFDVGKSRVGYNPSLLRMPEGAQGTITTLSKSYPLGIVTGRIRDSVFEFPDLEKLSPLFSAVVSYEDTVNHKPHPEPLLLAAEQLNIPPTACVYVGDVENDMIAARAAGMKGIHFTKSDEHRGDARLSSFNELLTLLSRLP